MEAIRRNIGTHEFDKELTVSTTDQGETIIWDTTRGSKRIIYIFTLFTASPPCNPFGLSALEGSDNPTTQIRDAALVVIKA